LDGFIHLLPAASLLALQTVQITLEQRSQLYLYPERSLAPVYGVITLDNVCNNDIVGVMATRSRLEGSAHWYGLRRRVGAIASSPLT